MICCISLEDGPENPARPLYVTLSKSAGFQEFMVKICKALIQKISDLSRKLLLCLNVFPLEAPLQKKGFTQYLQMW